MKIYLFNPDSGAYLGEDFADEAIERGTFVHPPDATAIAPPKVEMGQVLIFNAGIQQWEVHQRQCIDSPLPTRVKYEEMRRMNHEQV